MEAHKEFSESLNNAVISIIAGTAFAIFQRLENDRCSRTCIRLSAWPDSLSGKTESPSARSDDLSIKADGRSSRIGCLSTKVDGRSNHSVWLSTKVDRRSNRSGWLSTKADRRSNRSGWLSTKADGRSSRSGCLSTKVDGRSSRSGRLSTALFPDDTAISLWQYVSIMAIVPYHPKETDYGKKDYPIQPHASPT